LFLPPYAPFSSAARASCRPIPEKSWRRTTHEVGVDAETGKLLENSVEGSHAD
jgi:hypothetical protein